MEAKVTQLEVQIQENVGFLVNQLFAKLRH
jgi:hypothetical protein